MKANYYTRRGISVGGKIHVLEDRMIFKPHLFNVVSKEVEIFFKDILGVQLETIVAPMVRINFKNGTSCAFVLFQRKKLKNLLEEKIT